MQGDLDTRFFRYRQNPLHEPDIIVEHLLFAIDAVFRLWNGSDAGHDFARQRPLHIKSRHLDAAAPDGRRRAPNQIGHPVQAEDGDARLAHIARHLLVILDLLVSARAVEHGISIKLPRHILDRFQHQAVIVDLLLQPFQVTRIKIALVFGQVVCFGYLINANALADHVELHTAHAQLFGEGQIIVRCCRMLT